MKGVALFLVIAPVVLTAACSNRERRERAAALADGSAKQENAHADERPKPVALVPDEAGKGDAAGEEQAEVERAKTVEAAFAVQRKTLLSLSQNPRAIAPSEFYPPDDTDPETTTFTYNIPGIGKVTQSRASGGRWTVFISDVAEPPQISPQIFAPLTGLKELATRGRVTWWRVTAGPFNRAFVMRSIGGIEVRSKANVCAADVRGLSEVRTSCAQY